MASQATAQTAALLEKVWQRSLPILRERLGLLDQTTARAAAGTLTCELRAEAVAVSHKLAGSLGMFGHHEGTAIARQIEQLLQTPADPQVGYLADLVTKLRAALPPDL